MVLKMPTRVPPPRSSNWMLVVDSGESSRRVLYTQSCPRTGSSTSVSVLLPNTGLNHCSLPSVLRWSAVLPTCSQTCVSRWDTHTCMHTHAHTHTTPSSAHCCSNFPKYHLSSGDGQHFQGWYCTVVPDSDYHGRDSRFPNKCFGSVQFSRSFVSNSLPPREPQHTRPPCPSPTPGGYPNSWTSVYMISSK